MRKKFFLFFNIVGLSLVLSIFLVNSAQATLGVDWTEATDDAAWPARGIATVVTFDDKLWILGGFDGVNYLDDVWYSSDGVTWTEATDSAGFGNRSNHTAVVFDDKIWVMGGFDNDSNYLDDVWYSSDGVTWIEATDAPGWVERGSHASVVFDDKIWVMGGYDSGFNALNDVWYSSDGVAWTEATDSADWEGRSTFSAVVFDDKIWVMGGADSGFNGINDVWYSSDGATWTEATDSAGFGNRSNHTAVVFDDKIWVMGGFDNDSLVFFDDVWYTVLVTAPQAPQNLSATEGDEEVGLSWEAPFSDGGSDITGYKIFRDTSSPATTLLDTVGDVLVYEDTSVTNGTEYFYRVQAVNAEGDSDYSNEDSATPTQPASNAPRLTSGSAPSRARVVNQDPPNDCLPTYRFSPSTGRPCPNVVNTPAPTPAPTCTISTILRLGSRGEQVRCLQTLLSANADGIFGPQTQQFVINFQTQNNLIPDGLVGPRTRAALFE